MSRSLGDEKRGQNFEILATAPIDARLITPTKSSLTSLTGKYNGMICAVNSDGDNNGLYICFQNQGVNDDDWKEVGASVTLVQSNWNEDDTTSDAFIKNKPDLSNYITADSENTLTNKSISYSQITSQPDLTSFITADSEDTLTNKSISYSQITDPPDIPSVDDSITENGTNPVESQAIYTALDGKQDTLTSSSTLTISSILTSSSIQIQTGHNGRVKIGALFNNNWATFANFSAFSSTKYALAQNTNGQTLINSGPDQPIVFRNSNQDLMYLSNAGNFGINNSSPQEKLHVDGNIRLGLGYKILLGNSVSDTNSVNAGLYWHTANNRDYAISKTNGAWSNPYQQLQIKFITGIILDGGSGFGKSFVDVPSKLGINVSSKPTEQFEVNGDSKITGSLLVNGEITSFGQSSPLAKIMCDNGTSNTNAGQQRLYMTPATIVKEADNSLTDFAIKNTCNTSIRFHTGTEASNPERVRITNEGKIGVGTSSPDHKLHLHEESATGVWLKSTNTSNSTGFLVGVDNLGHAVITNQASNKSLLLKTNNTTRVTINPTGDVMIGSTNVQTELDKLSDSSNLGNCLSSTYLSLSSGSFNLFDGTEDYTWTGTGDNVAIDNTGSSTTNFIALKKGFYSIDVFLKCADGTVNNRVRVHGYVLIMNGSGAEINRGYLSDSYYRDDHNNYDELIISGNVVKYLNVGHRFRVRTQRTDRESTTGTLNVEQSSSRLYCQYMGIGIAQ